MLYTDYTDDQLLPLIREGDAVAFDVLYQRHWQALYAVARNILRSTELAKDIVQEVFASFWQRRSDLEIIYPKAYLQQAVRNQVLNAIRANKADDGFYQRLAEVSREIVEENPLIFKELRHILADLIGSLPEDCRMVFHLSREEELTYNQIADYLNISVKTVEKKMSRSLRIIRSRLDRSAISIIVFLTFFR
jgi:RNA polymerase sigma-70 factor (ECF subfamily)